jgi:AcrR family transcriptional regulator
VRVAKQERAVVTRQQIVRAAAECFDVTGYERTTLSDIVDGSGVTKGALYFHFKSKDDLGTVVIDEQHAISMATVSRIRATGTPALEQLVMLTHEMGRQIVEDPVVRAGIRLTLELSAAEGPATPYVDWIAGLDRLFHDAADEGDLSDTVDAAHLARYFVSAFTGVQLVSNVLTQRRDLDVRIDQMLDIFVPSIMAPRRRRRFDAYRHARWTSTSI